MDKEKELLIKIISEALKTISEENNNLVIMIRGKKITFKSVDELQELVDRATPMKPIYKMNSYDYNQAYCGRCNSMVENSYKYCHYCGQAIDWSENERNGK